MNGVVANIDSALNTLVPTGVKLVLVNVTDNGVAPWAQVAYPSAAGRQAVADVTANQLNPQIEALAQAHNLPYVDLEGLSQAVFGSHSNLNSTLAIGNININLQQTDTILGTNPTAAFVDDGVNINTTLQGLIANLVLTGLNIGYDANIPLFSEQEILAHAGIAYGGSDTLSAQVGGYADYVTNYVPEPSSLVLASLAATILLARYGKRK